jgi:hypothetical protein
MELPTSDIVHQIIFNTQTSHTSIMNKLMVHSRQVIASILLFSALGIFGDRAVADSDPFYQAIARTQNRQHSQAIEELDTLGSQFQQQGDLTNAYRSQAMASFIRYELDPYKYGRYRPDWYHTSSCWGGAPIGCYGMSWVEPPTAVGNFGGLLIFDSPRANTPVGSTPMPDGLLDAVVVPKLNANEQVSVLCHIISGPRKNQSAIALVTYNAQLNKFTKIRKAWYTDRQTKRIKSIEPRKVTCPDPYDPEA